MEKEYDTHFNYPLSIHIFATSYCNLQCRHCFIDATRNIQKRLEINASEVLWIIKESNRLIKHVNFELEGGEILLHTEVDSILRGLTSNDFSNLILTTNGTIAYPFDKVLNEKELKQLQLRVSLEGHTQHSHGALRNSSIEEIFTNIKFWRTMGISIVLRVTLHRENFQYIQNMVDKFASIGVDEIRFFEFQNAGRGALEESRKYSLDNDSYMRVLECFSQVNKPKEITRLSLNVSSSRKQMLNSYQSTSKNNAFIEEQSTGNSLCINWDGSLALCPWSSFKTKICTQDLSNYTENLIKLLNNNMLAHGCEHCSITSLIKEN